ncbi:CubicO group peptidase (beta-lactamase class C family) [Paraburkholderia sp. GAS333]|uniref:serine hydrolase domain-containing protein n=1 Tax=Paraburkholderia sp. GAS333 TaxID=3156279 RepID=UPI003D2600F2
MLNNDHPNLKDLDGRVAAFLADSGGAFSGAYLVAINGALMLQGARGLANREFEVPNGRSTRFRIGSITKQFTAAVVLLLAEQRMVTLDDPVGRFLPETNNVWRDVTLRMLLCHRSGIPSYTSLESFPKEISKIDRTPREIIGLVRELPLDFAPGSRALYSNSGYTVLGCVIEQACAQAYAEVLRSLLFEPLGMADTGCDDGLSVIPALASGYVYDDGEWLRAPHIAMSLPFAAGGLYSTVDDLAVWHRALHDGPLLRDDSRSVMFTDHGDGMGLGTMVNKGEPRIRFHGGGVNGFLAAASRVFAENWTADVIVLANNGNADPKLKADPFYISKGLLALASGNSVDAPGIMPLG